MNCLKWLISVSVIQCILHSEAALPSQKVPLDAAGYCKHKCKQHHLHANGIVYFFKRYHLAFQLVLHIYVVSMFGANVSFHIPDHKVATLSSCCDQ